MSDMKDGDSATLARIDERTSTQTTMLASHAAALASHVKEDSDHRAEDKKDSNDKFEKVFNFVSKRFDKMDDRFDKMEAIVGDLRDERNERKGAIGLSKLLSGGVYACIALAAGYFGGISHK